MSPRKTPTTNLSNKSVFERAQQALEALRPFLQKDEGDARLVAVDAEGVAHIELLGACATCPMSAMTMQNGIEKNIKQQVPEINKVTHHIPHP